MAVITWSPQLSVEIREIDDQHKRLIDLINQLGDAMKDGRGREVVGKVLGELIRYTQFHFGTEERLMKTHGYPEDSHHFSEHKRLVDQVVKLQSDTAKLSVTVETMTFLRDWLNHHILQVDKKLGAYLKSRGVS